MSASIRSSTFCKRLRLAASVAERGLFAVTLSWYRKSMKSIPLSFLARMLAMADASVGHWDRKRLLGGAAHVARCAPNVGIFFVAKGADVVRSLNRTLSLALS